MCWEREREINGVRLGGWVGGNDKLLFLYCYKASRLIELEHDARRKGKENVLVKVLVGSKRGDGLHARTSEGAPSPQPPSRDAALELEGGDTLPLLFCHLHRHTFKR